MQKITGRKGVFINQDLTKTRNNLAYHARQLLKSGKAQSSFIFDGKIFLVDHNWKKYIITTLDDLIRVKNKLCPEYVIPSEACDLYTEMDSGES